MLLRSELQGYLVRVWSFLERAEASLGKLPIVHGVSRLPEIHVGSAVEGEADLYGCFSLHAVPCPPPSSGIEVMVDAVDPEIMPELQELCG